METTETSTTLPDIEGLWYGCQDSKSREYDWSVHSEDWQSFEAEHVECREEVTCPNCCGIDPEQDEPICGVCVGDGVRPCDFEGYVTCSRLGDWTCPTCDADHETYGAEGPMMNYFYALPDHGSFDKDDALKLEGLPLCLVEFSQGGYNDYNEAGDDSLPDWALALTGGGMDLSWQIAEAHMRLGYMPPLFCCDLPRMGGMDVSSPTNAWVIAGCRRSAQAVRDEGQRMMDKLDELAKVNRS